MCGIVGLYLKKPELEAQLGKLFEPMLEAMTDRGPDSAGFAIYGDEVADGWVKLTLQATSEGFDFKALIAAVDARLGTALEWFQNANAAVLKVQADDSYGNLVHPVRVALDGAASLAWRWRALPRTMCCRRSDPASSS